MVYSCYVSIQFYNNNNTPLGEVGGGGLQGMLALTLLKILLKNFFLLWFALYASAHHDARRALCDTQTFVENDVFSPEKSNFDNPILL